MKSSILAVGLTAWWPIWLVCAGGVLLVVISVLALLAVRGQGGGSPSWRLRHAVAEGKKQPRLAAVQFYRIGWEADTRKAFLVPEQWCTVGSGKRADFCLDEADVRLEADHFQMCLHQSVLQVAAAKGETFVNGVPIRALGTVPVHSGDLIRAGSYEYRVIFSPGEEKEKAT